MIDVVIPLGIPALVTGLIWLTLHRFAGVSRSVREISAIVLPTLFLLLLYYVGVGGAVGPEEIVVMAIVVACQWMISGVVVFLLESRLRSHTK